MIQWKKKTFKIGQLYYKYIQGSVLEKNEYTNRSEKIAAILEYMGFITTETITYPGDSTPIVKYHYNAGMEYPKGKIILLLNFYANTHESLQKLALDACKK